MKSIGAVHVLGNGEARLGLCGTDTTCGEGQNMNLIGCGRQTRRGSYTYDEHKLRKLHCKQ